MIIPGKENKPRKKSDDENSMPAAEKKGKKLIKKQKKSLTESSFEKLLMEKIARGSKNIFKIQKRGPSAEREGN